MCISQYFLIMSKECNTTNKCYKSSEILSHQVLIDWGNINILFFLEGSVFYFYILSLIPLKDALRQNLNQRKLLKFLDILFAISAAKGTPNQPGGPPAVVSLTFKTRGWIKGFPTFICLCLHPCIIYCKQFCHAYFFGVPLDQNFFSPLSLIDCTVVVPYFVYFGASNILYN